MKGKIIMYFTIGLICTLLISVIFVQFKTVDVINKSGISYVDARDLKEELNSWKTKYDEVYQSLQDNKKLLEEYNSEDENDSALLELLKQDLKTANTNIGYTDVQGPGIEIVLEDGDSQVTYSDILLLVNELKYAGAEAISINDERIVNITDIVDIKEKFTLVNGQRLISPYTIKAIGDSKYLESAITIRGGYIDEIKSASKKISYSLVDNVVIKKYNGTIELNYGE